MRIFHPSSGDGKVEVDEPLLGYVLSPGFLMEIMEVRMEVEETLELVSGYKGEKENVLNRLLEDNTFQIDSRLDRLETEFDLKWNHGTPSPSNIIDFKEVWNIVAELNYYWRIEKQIKENIGVRQ